MWPFSPSWKAQAQPSSGGPGASGSCSQLCLQEPGSAAPRAEQTESRRRALRIGYWLCSGVQRDQAQQMTWKDLAVVSPRAAEWGGEEEEVDWGRG